MCFFLLSSIVGVTAPPEVPLVASIEECCFPLGAYSYQEVL